MLQGQKASSGSYVPRGGHPSVIGFVEEEISCGRLLVALAPPFSSGPRAQRPQTINDPMHAEPQVHRPAPAVLLWSP